MEGVEGLGFNLARLHHKALLANITPHLLVFLSPDAGLGFRVWGLRASDVFVPEYRVINFRPPRLKETRLLKSDTDGQG